MGIFWEQSNFLMFLKEVSYCMLTKAAFI